VEKDQQSTTHFDVRNTKLMAATNGKRCLIKHDLKRKELPAYNISRDWFVYFHRKQNVLAGQGGILKAAFALKTSASHQSINYGNSAAATLIPSIAKGQRKFCMHVPTEYASN
jgi:hypothetical protein